MMHAANSRENGMLTNIKLAFVVCLCPTKNGERRLMTQNGHSALSYQSFKTLVSNSTLERRRGLVGTTFGCGLSLSRDRFLGVIKRFGNDFAVS